MKRWLGLLLGIGVLLLGWSAFRSADASESQCGLIEEQVTVLARGGAGKAFVAVDDLGEVAYIDPRTDETITPLRPFFTILSDEGAVQWDESTRTARFSHAAHQLMLQVTADGRSIKTTLDGAPYELRAHLCDGRLHAPLRGVTDALGLELRWYSADMTAVIDPVWTTGVQPPVQESTPTPKTSRPAECNSVERVGWSDWFIRPLNAWGRTVRNTACALII